MKRWWKVVWQLHDYAITNAYIYNSLTKLLINLQFWLKLAHPITEMLSSRIITTRPMVSTDVSLIQACCPLIFVFS